MAEVLKKIEPSSYPWHQWEDGKAYRVKRGEDFDCTLDSFESLLYKRARDRGYKLTRTRNDEAGTVDFQFSKPSPKRRRS